MLKFRVLYNGFYYDVLNINFVTGVVSIENMDVDISCLQISADGYGWVNIEDAEQFLSLNS